MAELKTRGTRWWPAALVVIAATIALWIIWRIPEMQRQDRLVATAITLLSTLFLLLVWVLLFSRMRKRVRLGVLLFVLLGGATLALNFEIRGVTGDLVPIVEFRWKKKPELSSPTVAKVEGVALATNTVQVTGLSFPQFMGPSRNGVLANIEIDPHWKAYPPKLLWKQPVGAAWSGFVIQDQFAITQEQRGEQELVVCYDLLTGKATWSHADEAKYSTTLAGEGPRSTPAIAGDRVYAFGATGILNCLELASGKLQWSRNIRQEHEANLPEWGFAASPLVQDGRVYVHSGGPNNRALVCYEASDGKFIWGAGDTSPQYSSPIFVELLGVPQIVAFQGKLWGCSMEGKPLWSHPWPGGQPRVSLPVVLSTNQLLVSTGYGVGAELLAFSKDEQGNIIPSRVWKSLGLKSKFGPIFVIEEHVYGLDDGIFACISLADGKRKWKEGRYGHGQGLQAGGHILLTTEQGEVVLIEPNPHELKEVASLPVFEDKTWNPPALAGKYLLVRNHLEAACFQLRTKSSGSVVAEK